MTERYDVVYVDDEPNMTEIFNQMVAIKYRGWRALALNDAEALFKNIEEGSISAAVWIVDLMMPGKNGLQIAQAVRDTGDSSAALIGYTALDLQTMGSSKEYGRALDIFTRVVGKQEGFLRVLAGLNATILNQPRASNPG